MIWVDFNLWLCLRLLSKQLFSISFTPNPSERDSPWGTPSAHCSVLCYCHCPQRVGLDCLCKRGWRSASAMCYAARKSFVAKVFLWVDTEEKSTKLAGCGLEFQSGFPRWWLSWSTPGTCGLGCALPGDLHHFQPRGKVWSSLKVIGLEWMYSLSCTAAGFLTGAQLTPVCNYLCIMCVYETQNSDWV